MHQKQPPAKVARPAHLPALRRTLPPHRRPADKCHRRGGERRDETALIRRCASLGIRRHERQRDPVHAVAQARGRRPVIEHVAEMAAAAAAVHLGPGREQAAVLGGPMAFSSGAKKLGQPVPLSYLVSEENSGRSQPAH